MKILLFRGKGLISALIRWQTRAPYSHVAIVVGDWLFEAWQGEGVRRMKYSEHVAKHGTEGIDVFELTVPCDEEKVRAFLFRELGQGYDYWGILRFISRRRMPVNAKWFCSEYGFEAVLAGGVRLLQRIESAEVHPGLVRLSPLLKLSS